MKIKKLFKVIEKKEKIFLFFITSLAILASFIEVVGIGSIVGYITFLTSPQDIILKIPSETASKFLINLSSKELIIFCSISLILIFLVKNLFLFFFYYVEAKITKNLTVNISAKLLNYYLSKKYFYFLNINSSKIINSIMAESSRFVVYLYNLLLVFREGLVLFFLIILLFNFNSFYSFVIISVMIVLSLIFFLNIRRFVKKIGIEEKEYHALNLKVLNEIFNAIKTIKLSKNLKFWSKKYYNYKNKFQSAKTKNLLIGRLPRLFLEFGSVVTLVSIILIFFMSGKDIYEIISLLTLITLILIRALPAFVNINIGLNSLNYNSETYKTTLSNLNFAKDNESLEETTKDQIDEIKNIKLSNVDFAYNKNKTILKNISLEIKKGKMTGVVGKTGSGKSTLVDIITGLLNSTAGNLDINGKDINNISIGAISYITQDTILVDDTIINNVCFGIKEKNINKIKYQEAIKISQLDEFIDQLPDRENTFVGDRGIRISGGQKQRIGIARAIYNNSEILIMDEATSALDYETEKRILNEISKLKESKIIIMITHRLSALELCDEVILLESGKIKYFGKADKIKEKYENFLESEKTD